MDFFLFIVAPFFIGFVVSSIATSRGWSAIRTLFTSAVVGAVYSVIAVTLVYAAEVPFTKLKDTTLHIAIGSASIIEAPSGKHYMLTNWHVCNSGSWLGVMRGNAEGGKLYQGKITKVDPRYDLCAVRLQGPSPALRVAKSLKPGQEIYTRGYPLGVLSEATGRFLNTETWEYSFPIEEVGECFKGSTPRRGAKGTVEECSIRYEDNMTNAYSRPGSSGSPVVDASGELVGVMSSWYAGKDLGGMVKLEAVQDFFRDL